MRVIKRLFTRVLKTWEAVMSTNFGAGFHVAPGRAVDASAYERFTGRWSRLFVPSVLGAAEVAPGSRVLDVSTGTGEAALGALPIVGASSFRPRCSKVRVPG
jgi:hypothetical protein